MLIDRTPDPRVGCVQVPRSQRRQPSQKGGPMENDVQSSLSDLKTFAERCIGAEHYPNDYHVFSPFECHACGVVPLRLRIEHHTGSRKGRFRGVIFARCAKCGEERRVFSFTGEHRRPLREERPVCRCGSKEFLAGNCERLEGDEGVPGFFDGGVIVGKCVDCGRNRAFVHTD